MPRNARRKRLSGFVCEDPEVQPRERPDRSFEEDPDPAARRRQASRSKKEHAVGKEGKSRRGKLCIPVSRLPQKRIDHNRTQKKRRQIPVVIVDPDKLQAAHLHKKDLRHGLEEIVQDLPHGKPFIDAVLEEHHGKAEPVRGKKRRAPCEKCLNVLTGFGGFAQDRRKTGNSRTFVRLFPAVYTVVVRYMGIRTEVSLPFSV